MYASQSSYRDHLRPVWDALEPAEQGTWMEKGSRPSGATTWLSASQRDFSTLEKTKAHRVVMEHGVGLQWYPDLMLQRLCRASAIAAPNAFIAERYREHSKRVRIEIVGTPKMDLLQASTPGPAAAISFHWTGVLRQRETSLAAWKPLVEELGAERELLGHAHPKIWRQAERFYRELGIEPVRSFEEVCARSNLYLSDHGSTLYEWAALDRELILLRKGNNPVPIPWRSGLLWKYFSGIGPELKLGGSLRAALEAAAETTYRDARLEATAALYPHIGSARQRVIDLLREVEEEP